MKDNTQLRKIRDILDKATQERAALMDEYREKLSRLQAAKDKAENDMQAATMGRDIDKFSAAKKQRDKVMDGEEMYNELIRRTESVPALDPEMAKALVSDMVKVCQEAEAKNLKIITELADKMNDADQELFEIRDNARSLYRGICDASKIQDTAAASFQYQLDTYIGINANYGGLGHKTKKLVDETVQRMKGWEKYLESLKSNQRGE